MVRRFYRWLAPAALAILAACGGTCGGDETAGASGSAGDSAWYRATIEGEIGPVPFYLHLPGPHEEGEAAIRNGTQQLPVDHEWSEGYVTMWFRHWGTSIEAKMLDSGELEGVWVASRLFDQFEAPFAAEPVVEPDPHRLFPGDGEPEVDAAGVWRADFARSGAGEMRLEQVEPGLVEGTVVQRELSGGDFGNVVGNIRGDQLSLATFDGQKAFRLDARVASGGQMAGQWEFVGIWEERFRAVRGELDEDVSVVMVGDHNRHIEVPGLDDPRYEGKPVIVGLFGTWCTTCGDLAPVIRDLSARYRDRGLEVHAVAYEIVDDEEYIEEQIATYRERYSAEWPIVPIPGEVEPQLPPELQGLDVLPITMFRNPDGTVHAIRTGFVSPASGDEHARQIAEFESLTKAIVGADS